MKKSILIALIAILSPLAAAWAAKPITVQGRVLDGNSMKPLVGATVVVKDTTKNNKIHAIVNEKGEFTLTNIPRNKGELTLSISFVSYKELTRAVNTNVDLNTINVGVMKLYEQIAEIDEVTVEGKAPMAVQKGDTIQYNASAFKVNSDAYAEDLVKKIPGVTVDKQGNVKAQGQDVKKVYIDGKRLFGNDPKTALKNLPANLIKNVQIFDDTDEQSKFAGYNDGEKEKAFNIITTKGIKGAGFGRVESGYGVDEMKSDRYNAGVNAGMFKEGLALMANVNTNNLNMSRFGSGDMFGAMSGGGNGLSKSTTAGFTLGREFNKSTRFDVNYMYDRTNETTIRETLRNYFETPNIAAKEYASNNWNNSQNHNNRFNFNFDGNITKNNRLSVRTNGNFQKSNSHSIQSAYNFQHDFTDSEGNVAAADTVNKNRSDNYSNRDGYSVSLRVMWMHRFTKEGRSFSLSFDTDLSNSNSGDEQTGWTNIYNAGVANRISNDQYTDGKSRTRKYNVRAIYSEPIGRYSQFKLNYVFDRNRSNSDRMTYSDRTMNSLYDSLSNAFSNDVARQRLGVGYSYNNGTNSLNVGVDLEYNIQNKDQSYPTTLDPSQKHLKHNYISWAPNVRYMYYLEKTRFLSIDYTGRTQIPSVEQLQRYVNTTNTLLISTGNPDLKQAYTHSLDVRYNFTDPEGSRNLYFGLGVQNTMNAIRNNTYTLNLKPGEVFQIFDYKISAEDSRGVRFSQPINMDGYWTISSLAGYSFLMSAIKSNLNLDANYSYSRQPSYYENIKNQSQAHSLGLSVSVNSNISEYIDFMLSSSSTYNFAKNTTQTDSKYFTQNLSAFLNLTFWQSWVLTNDLNYTYNHNTNSSTFSNSYTMWNVAVAKKFWKKMLELRLSANDLLKQNSAYQHSINDTYIEDSRSNVMGRYFLATLSFRFSSMDKYRNQMPRRRGEWRNQGSQPPSRGTVIMRQMGGRRMH